MNHTSSVSVSVVMVITETDSYSHLHDSLQSIVDQTSQPSTIFIAFNGPIAQPTRNLVNSFSNILPISIIEINVLSPFGYCLAQIIPFVIDDYICRHDPDDIMTPSRIQRQYHYLQTSRNVDIVGSSCFLIDLDNSVFSIQQSIPAPFIKRNLWRNPFIHSSVMFRSSLFINSTSYSWLSRAQDLELWFRLASLGIGMANISEPLIYYRLPHSVHKKSFSSALYQYSLVTKLIFKYKTNFRGLLLYLGVFIKPFIPSYLWNKLSK